MKILFSIVFLFTFIISVCGQGDSLLFKNSGETSFYLAPHYGFIVPHTSLVVPLVQGHSVGADFLIEKRTNGNRAWQQHYGFPSHGLNYFYNYTGNPDALGSQHVLAYSLRLPLDKFETDELRTQNTRGKNSVAIHNKHDLMLGIGAGYATRVWNLQDNHQAAVLGSHFNVALVLQYQHRINSVYSKRRLSGGLRITHLSNGSIKTPNLGTNNVTIYIGCALHKTGVHYAYKQTNEELKKVDYKKNTATLSLTAGLKEIQPPLGRKYQTLTFSYLQDRRVSYKSSVGLGSDLFYNAALKPLIERYRDYTPSVTKTLQLGLLLSYTLHFNAFELKMQQGIYIIDHWKNDGLFYHRFGLRYRFAKHCFAQLTLKTHFAKADFAELGMGYAF
jgi:Lipid A 3-O-deacylase (PagL)